MRPRSANEWRRFWHRGGERQLEAVLRASWKPLADVDDDICATQAERIALLLGSAAPARAIAAELGRIRRVLHVEPDAAADEATAVTVREWFDTVRP
jgi:hypothetical protein